MDAREIIESVQPRRKFPDFRTGDTVRVHVRIAEAEKERIQVFEGTVIKRRRGGQGASFTVRKISYGVGVERVFPFASPAIDKIEVLQMGKVRRARLFYLRKRRGRESQIHDTDTSRTMNGAEEEAQDASSERSAETAPAAEVESATTVAS